MLPRLCDGMSGMRYASKDNEIECVLIRGTTRKKVNLRACSIEEPPDLLTGRRLS